MAGIACSLRRKAQPPGKPWIWRTEFFGHEPQGDIALLGRGFHVAYMDVQNMYGAPVALDHMDKFYDELTRNRGLSAKPVLEGFSRGGLFAFNWAARHPDRVSAIYADAPVCDFKSWPGGKRTGKGSPGDWERLKPFTASPKQQALAYHRQSRGQPRAAGQGAASPSCTIVGDADDRRAGRGEHRAGERALREARRRNQGHRKPGVDHHPHSLKDPTPIVEFILSHPPGFETQAK